MARQLSRDLEVAQRIEASLGEVPVWDAERQVLIWVDVTNRIVHQWSPATDRDEAMTVDGFVGAAVPWKPGHLALATADGFGDLDLVSGAFEVFARLPTPERPSLMNDAKCDGLGRYWGGTIALDLSAGAGKLYRLDLDGTIQILLEGLHISNGLGWSPDNRVMYLVDSFDAMFAFDFDMDEGTITRQRRLIEVPRSEGVMDGLTVDQEGHIWVAIFGGSSVRRYTAAGELVAEIPLPITHPTSCVFGGPDLEDLYITSARQDENGPMDASRLINQPLAGSVFRVRPGVRGLPTHSFTGNSLHGYGDAHETTS